MDDLARYLSSLVLSGSSNHSTAAFSTGNSRVSHVGSMPATLAGTPDIPRSRDRVAHPVLLAEAKTADLGQSGLAGMMSIFTELSGGPPSTVGPGARTNASRKYAGLLLRTPVVLAAVAPGVRRFYDVAYSDGVAELAFLTERGRVKGSGMRCLPSWAVSGRVELRGGVNTEPPQRAARGGRVLTPSRVDAEFVRPEFGFNWRDEDPGGLQSQLWLMEARAADDEVIRLTGQKRILAYNEDDVRATAAIRNGL